MVVNTVSKTAGYEDFPTQTSVECTENGPEEKTCSSLGKKYLVDARGDSFELIGRQQ